MLNSPRPSPNSRIRVWGEAPRGKEVPLTLLAIYFQPTNPPVLARSPQELPSALPPAPIAAGLALAPPPQLQRGRGRWEGGSER